MPPYKLITNTYKTPSVIVIHMCIYVIEKIKKYL